MRKLYEKIRYLGKFAGLNILINQDLSLVSLKEIANGILKKKNQKYQQPKFHLAKTS